MYRVRRKVASRLKVVRVKEARARARVELKPLLPQQHQQHQPRKTKWTSLVMTPRLTPLLPKP